MITEQRVRELVDHFAAEQGLTKYSVVFSKSKSLLGRCHYVVPVYDSYLKYQPFKSTVKLEFSTYWMEHAPLEEVIDTILHELAHGLAGPRAKHGPEWKSVAKSLGCTPKASTDFSLPQEVKESTSKWRGTCPNGHKTFSNRLTDKGRRKSCGRCSNVYNPSFMYRWEQLR